MLHSLLISDDDLEIYLLRFTGICDVSEIKCVYSNLNLLTIVSYTYHRAIRLLKKDLLFCE